MRDRFVVLDIKQIFMTSLINLHTNQIDDPFGTLSRQGTHLVISTSLHGSGTVDKRQPLIRYTLAPLPLSSHHMLSHALYSDTIS